MQEPSLFHCIQIMLAQLQYINKVVHAFNNNKNTINTFI